VKSPAKQRQNSTKRFC